MNLKNSHHKPQVDLIFNQLNHFTIDSTTNLNSNINASLTANANTSLNSNVNANVNQKITSEIKIQNTQIEQNIQKETQKIMKLRIEKSIMQKCKKVLSRLKIESNDEFNSTAPKNSRKSRFEKFELYFSNFFDF